MTFSELNDSFGFEFADDSTEQSSDSAESFSPLTVQFGIKAVDQSPGISTLNCQLNQLQISLDENEQFIAANSTPVLKILDQEEMCNNSANLTPEGEAMVA